MKNKIGVKISMIKYINKINVLLIKIRYYIFRYIIEREYFNYRIAKMLDLKKIDDGTNFFGYYNLSPENKYGDITYLKKNNVDTVDLIVERDGIKHKVATSSAWNWQQGCMLQWYPKEENRIIYNDFDKTRNMYISKLLDRDGGLVEIYDMPINNVGFCDGYALTLNYERLALLRPDYGYFCKENRLLSNVEDGIWRIDLKSKQIDLIITLEKLVNIKYTETMEGAIHKVNHIDINRSGERFMFLHRWISPMGRFTRLITSNLSGEEIYILNGDKMTSHSCWYGDDEIISFCFTEKYGNSYIRFHDGDKRYEMVSNKLPKQDGHPSVSKNREWMIYDTYPTLGRISTLNLYNFRRDTTYEIGKFYQPLEYIGQRRIDLHPKWNPDCTRVYFESGHSGERRLYSIDLDRFFSEINNG